MRLLATPPPYAGHDFATNSAGPKNSALAPKKFVHIKASWHQVTQTCRQIYLEANPLFFASESYYLASFHELTDLIEYDYRVNPIDWKHVLYGYSTVPLFRRDLITTLCLEGLVTDKPLYTIKQIDNMLSDPTDYRSGGRTRQQLEAQTVKRLDTRACVRLSKLPNLETVGLRMRVGQEMEHVNFLYGVSGMSRGLVEFLDQSHWLIRTQDHNDEWRIQYSCFTFGDYARDKNMERIPYDRRLVEEEVTDIDSRAPGLQEGDERYIEAQIQRNKSDDNKTRTVSEISGAGPENPFDTRATLRPEPSDHSTTQAEELQGILDPAHDEGEIEVEVPPMEMEEDLQSSQLDNDLSRTELEQEILNTSESFVRSQSQDDYDSQSNEPSVQENDHALSETASHDFSGIQSTEPSHQQAEEPLLPTYSKFAWHPTPTNTDSSRRFQTDSDDEDSNLQNKSRLGNQVPQSTQTKEDKAERHRRTRKRLLRQVQQPLSRFSNIPYPEPAEVMDSFRMLQELADLGINEETETGVQELIQFSTTSSEMREHGIKNPGATSQNATSIEKQPLTAFPKWFLLLSTFGQMWTVLLTFCYSCLLVIFVTASLQNLCGN